MALRYLNQRIYFNRYIYLIVFRELKISPILGIDKPPDLIYFYSKKLFSCILWAHKPKVKKCESCIKTMKKHILMAVFSLAILFSCKSVAQIQEQEPDGPVIPLHELRSYKANRLEIPQGAYLKDIHGDLDKFVGVWTGVYEVKNYEFTIVSSRSGNSRVIMDRVLIRFKVSDNSGVELVSTYNVAVGSPYIIKGRYLSTDRKDYTLSYSGYNLECGQSGWVTIKEAPADSTKIKLTLSISGGTWPSCEQDEEVDQVLPINQGIILTKQ